MEQSEINKSTWRPTNPHDRFCRRTAFHPLYASNFLKSYGDPVLVKYVDLDHLQEAPTTHLSGELKEIIMDASLATRLLDTNTKSEVLLHLEHKSRPSRTVTLQLLTEAALSLGFRWLLSKRSESGTFTPPIPLMVVVYNGSEDWNGEIWFQDLFPDLPEELRPFVPQFRVVFINLRYFQYDHLPGKPETQAITESLMRATDGTFIENLPGILKHVAEAGLDEQSRLDLTKNISSYCTWAAHATAQQIIKAISNVFKGQEYIQMTEMIKNEFILEGIAIGEARGEARGEAKGEAKGEARGEARGELKGKIHDILAILKTKFHDVPDEIVAKLNKRTDPTALESLVILAAQCGTIQEFIDALK